MLKEGSRSVFNQSLKALEPIILAKLNEFYHYYGLGGIGWVMEEGSGPRKILEYSVNCPVCGSSMAVEEYLYDMPMVGKVIISTGRCPRCGYRWSDVRLAETRGPRRIIYRVESPDDVNALVIRASTATIRIPELGVEIKPGPAAKGYITTVEGIIIDVLEKAEFLCSDEKASLEKCREKIELLKKARDGKVKYTVILEDPEGVSAIVSSKVKVEKLEDLGEK